LAELPAYLIAGGGETVLTAASGAASAPSPASRQNLFPEWLRWSSQNISLQIRRRARGAMSEPR